MTHSEECLICKKPLQYLTEAEEMTCMICGKKVMSNACCIDRHFVCDECHKKGYQLIKVLSLQETGKDPFVIANRLMQQDFIHMHGPEHHILVGAALLTAYKNAGGDIDLAKALQTMEDRGKDVPGGICGFWGSCGAAVSAGIFVSIITGATPLTVDSWALANLMTSEVLKEEAAIGGPRCCKRNAAISMKTAIRFAAEHFGIHMEGEPPLCTFHERNAQCIKERCPFHP